MFPVILTVFSAITLVFTLHAIYSPMWYLTEGLIFVMIISPFIGLFISFIVSIVYFVKRSVGSGKGTSKTILTITITVCISMAYSPLLAYFYAPVIAKEFKYSTKPTMGSGMLATSYSSIEELAKDTPLIISAKVESKSRFFDFGGVTFVETKLKIKDFFRNEYGLSKKSTVKLLQTYMEQDPVVSEEEESILFLKKYEGPIDEDAYVIVGAWFGHFKLKDAKLYSKVNGDPKFPAVTNMEDLSEILDSTPYEKPEPKTPMTKEEIEKLNERERQLERELTEI